MILLNPLCYILNKMKKIKITKKLLKKSILPAIITLQFLLIGILAWYLYWTHIEVNMQSTIKISTLINNAVEALNSPIPQDAKTGTLYIREAKMTLPPAPDRSLMFYYSYNPSIDGMNEEIRFSNKQLVDMQKNKVYAHQTLKEVFDEVPKLQACSRGYLVIFNKPDKFETDGHEVFQKKLKDGRTAYVYLEDKCADNKEKFIPYLQQMDSY
jgi:hypothetical protein